MGSITSRPKVPQIQQPIPQPIYYSVPVQQPVYTPPPVTSSPSTPATTDTANETQGEENVQAEARETGLLDRRRGRLSTVVNGFRGILSDTVAPNERKSLLGE